MVPYDLANIFFPLQQTAEIIALLYEATQDPPLPIEAPALNPTGGVIAKQPLGGLAYKKDPSRPGGGIFVAHGEARQGDFKDLPAGVVINSSDEESEGEASAPAMSSSTTASNDRTFLLSSSSFAPPLPATNVVSPKLRRSTTTSIAARSPVNAQLGGSGSGGSSTGGSSMVNFTPLAGGGGTGSFPNVNPAMNSSSTPGNVHVMNVLDVPQASNTLEQFAMADTGFLEGIPGGMFDWGE